MHSGYIQLALHCCARCNTAKYVCGYRRSFFSYGMGLCSVCVWVNDSPKLMEAVTATVPAEKFCKLLPIWVSAKCAGIGLPGCVVCIESPYQYSSDCSSSRLLRASLVLSGIYNL